MRTADLRTAPADQQQGRMLLLTLTLILTIMLTLTLTLIINPNTNPNHLPVRRSGPQSAFNPWPKMRTTTQNVLYKTASKLPHMKHTASPYINQASIVQFQLAHPVNYQGGSRGEVVGMHPFVWDYVSPIWHNRRK